MAARNRSMYRAGASAAYAPVYDGNAVRVTRRQEEQRTVTRRRTEQLEQTRPDPRVRQAGAVAPMAVTGAVCLLMMAALLLVSSLQLYRVTSSVGSLRSELNVLQEDNAALNVKYEQVFDVEYLQAMVGDTMVRPTSEQVTYIDMSQPDSVVVYSKMPRTQGVAGAAQGMQEIFTGVVEYFR